MKTTARGVSLRSLVPRQAKRRKINEADAISRLWMGVGMVGDVSGCLIS